MVVTRRQFIVAAATVPLAVHSILAYGRRGRGSVIVPSGFFDHTEPAFQPMRLVYPQADAITSTYAAHRWCYWDGTTGICPDIVCAIAFGRFPLIFAKTAGPAWLDFYSTTWQPGWVGSDAAADRYGVMGGTPTGPVVNETVSFTVTDQDNNTNSYSFTMNSDSGATASAGSISGKTFTAGGTVTGAFSIGQTLIGSGIAAGTVITAGSGTSWTVNNSQTVGSTLITGVRFVFADKTNGVSTNTGAIDSPLDDIPTVFGSTFAGATYPGGICVLRGSATAYTVPAYSPNGINSNPYFEPRPSLKPAAIIGYPGETATLDLSAAMIAPNGSDFLFGNLSLSGYDSSVSNYDAFYIYSSTRLTLDNIRWTGADYGGTGNTASMVFGGNSDLVMNAVSENGTGSPASASQYFYAGCDLYNVSGGLIQYCSANRPNATMSGAWYAKSDCTNVCIRENFALVGSASHAFSYGQAPDYAMQNNESRYNIGINVSGIYALQTGGYAVGDLDISRNNIIGNEGLASNETSYNLIAPVQNAITTTSGGSLPANTYYYIVHSLGVTGESNAIASHGASNEESVATSGSNSPVLGWNSVPNVSGFRVWRGTTSGGENVYFDVGNVTTWTDIGGAGTSGTMPTTQTALSATRIAWNSNAAQTSNSAVPPTGAALTNDGKNVVATSGMLDSSTGKMLSSWSGYATDYGKVGAEFT